MLQIKNLNITHLKDLRVILEDFSLVLNPGDKAVIIGEEGNGKSTLLKWIANPELIAEYTESSGELILTGERLGYLPQELPATEAGKSVYEFLSEADAFFESTPKALSQLTGRLMLPEGFLYSDQTLGTLSGGEKIKVQMARILLAEPTVLLLDEPSNDLDIETLKWLERLINGWDQIVLFISHDETLIEETANVVIHLEQLRKKSVCRYTVSHLPYRAYVEQRSSLMDRQRQQAINEQCQEKLRQEKWNRIMQKVEHAQATITRQDPATGRLLKKKMKAVKSQERRFERESRDRTKMPESEEAILVKFGPDIHIPNGKVILDLSLPELSVADRVLSHDLSLKIRGPEKICIVGRNGIGKSTLLKQIAEGLLSRTDIRAAYMPQNYEEALNLSVSPLEYLSITGDKEEKTRILTYLGAMKYTAEEMNRPIRELSGGQKAKIFLLRMSMSGADVLILDEPTRNFSPLSNPVIARLLQEFRGAIISVSHDRSFIRGVCTTVYELTEEGLKKTEL